MLGKDLGIGPRFDNDDVLEAFEGLGVRRVASKKRVRV